MANISVDCNPEKRNKRIRRAFLYSHYYRPPVWPGGGKHGSPPERSRAVNLFSILPLRGWRLAVAGLFVSSSKELLEDLSLDETSVI
jgi:hypothetical protein